MTDQLTLSLSFQWFWPMLTFVNHGSRGWWYCFLSLPVLCSPAHGTSHSLCMSTLLSGQILSTLFRIITDSSRSLFDSVQFSSATQSCPTLCDPTNCSTPGLSVHHQLPPKPISINQLCHPTISSSVIPFSSCPQSFPASGSFQMNQLFAQGGQSIRVSASASVLPMNIQDWFPLGWTG